MVQKTQDEEVKPGGHNVIGGKAASQPSDPDSLYPNGVDPSVSDEEHNARGQETPYSERQRKAAAILIRQKQADGMNLQDATAEAFKEVGEPEHMDEYLKSFKKSKTRH